MSNLLQLPEPPYTVVIFTNRRTGVDDEGYFAMADRMEELAREQDGFLGIESVRNKDGLNVTLSYWRDEAAARAWKQHPEHLEAQRLGREKWYSAFTLRVANVGRAYGFTAE